MELPEARLAPSWGESIREEAMAEECARVACARESNFAFDFSAVVGHN
jgi:hypothetical protein